MKKKLQLIIWSVLGATSIILLVSGMQKKDHKPCADIDIQLSGKGNHIFLNDDYINDLMHNAGAVKGNDVSTIDVENIEATLKKNPWVSDAQLFFDNKQVLHANIFERQPLARIFTLQGTSFYIDSTCLRLPLSNEETAQVPIFTSFPSANKTLSVPDSIVLQDVKNIAQYIQSDSFWMAQVAQIDITPQHTFEIIPVVGNQLIKLGDAENLDEKFMKLYSFYKQVFAKYGFEKYETIDVSFKNQVVTVRRGAQKTYSDSLRAMQIFGNSTKSMNAVLNDTTFAAPIIRTDTTVTNKKPTTQQTNAKTKTTTPKTKQPVVSNKKPKAVLPKKPVHH